MTKKFRLNDAANVLCTFTMNRQHFVALRNKDGELVCHTLHHDDWNGVYFTEDEVSSTVNDMAKGLVATAAFDRETFPMQGENYCFFLQDDNMASGDYLMISCDPLSRSTGSVLLHAVAQLAVCIPALMVYFGTCLQYTETHLLPFFGNSARILTFGGLSLLCTAVLFLLNRRNHRLSTLLANAVVPLGCLAVYDAAAWFPVVGVATAVAGTAAAIGTAAFLRKYKIHRRITSAVATAAIVCVMLCCGTLGAVHLSERNQDFTLSRYDTAVETLNPDNWSHAPASQQIHTLYVIHAYESIHTLHCEPVKHLDLQSDEISTLGCYDIRYHSLTIQRSFLSNYPVSEILIALLHESRHNWQHHICTNAVYEEELFHVSDTMLESFAYNLQNYKSDYLGFDIYRSQPVEVDAETWANFCMLAHYNFLLKCEA